METMCQTVLSSQQWQQWQYVPEIDNSVVAHWRNWKNVYVHFIQQNSLTRDYILWWCFSVRQMHRYSTQHTREPASELVQHCHLRRTYSHPDNEARQSDHQNNRCKLKWLFFSQMLAFRQKLKWFWGLIYKNSYELRKIFKSSSEVNNLRFHQF